MLVFEEDSLNLSVVLHLLGAPEATLEFYEPEGSYLVAIRANTGLLLADLCSHYR